MATYNKFNSFTTKLGLKLIDLNTDTFKVYLTNTAPVATNTVYNTPADIAAGFGYTAGGTDSQNTWSESPAGTGTMVATDITWTAAGGSIGPFRYAVIYDDTSASKWLMGWWDYASSITLADTETFTWDEGASLMAIT